MRLQLSLRAVAFLCAVIGAFAARPALAQPVIAVDLRAGIYQDTDHTFISTNTAVVRGTIKDRVTIKGRYLADIVSSASVDVVSAATKSFDEVRHEGEGAVAYADGTRTASVAYVLSLEPDWTSHSIRLGGSHDFFDHQLTIGAGGSVTWSAVGRADDVSFHRDLTQGTGSVDATVVASKNDLVSTSYTLMVLSGYQASPYRFVYVADPSVTSATLTFGNPETHPDGRIRHALGLRWNRHVFTDSAVRSQVRGYLDDWGVFSATAGVEYVIGFGAFEAALIARGYVQERAEFYEPTYATRLRYMTADRELATFIDGFGGFRVGYRGSPAKFLTELRADLKVEGFHFHYFDYPLLTDRSGIVGELGVGASF
jgi:hypothetical protein